MSSRSSTSGRRAAGRLHDRRRGLRHHRQRRRPAGLGRPAGRDPGRRDAQPLAWSASATWTDEVSGERRLISSDTGTPGQRSGPAARGDRPPDIQFGPVGRILVGLPERHLMTVARSDPAMTTSVAVRRLHRRAVRGSRRAHRPPRLRAGRRPAGRVPGDPARRLMGGERAASAFTSLRYEVADSIATITLDRPEALNALTVTLNQELLAALRSVARIARSGRSCRPERAGPSAPARTSRSGSSPTRLRWRSSCASATTRSSPRCGLGQPIVGAINGVAAGAGASLAFACDVRLAASRPASCWPSAGSGWSGQRVDLVAAPRRPGQGGGAGPDRGAVVGARCRTLRARRAGRLRRRPRGEARAIASRLAGLGPHRPRPDQTRARAELVDRSRGGARG